MREERIALENRIHRSLMRRNVCYIDSVDQYLSRVRVAESRKHAQQGGFAAS